MKKIFTFAAAFLASMALNAEVVYTFTLDPEVHTAKNTEYTVEGGSVTFGADKFETVNETYLYKLDGDPKDGNTKYALINLNTPVAEGDIITLTGSTPSNPKDGQAFLLADDRLATTQYAVLKPEVKGLCSVSFTVAAGDPIIGAESFYITRQSSSLHLGSVTIENGAEPSTDPELNASKESLSFEATAVNPNPSATVKFTGKNLTPGTYYLEAPGEASSWTVDPREVTVGQDGKLSAEIVITYAGNEFVESEESSISLTIDELKVTVTLSATSDMEKKYLNNSVNIEQWVLDNGKDTEAFKQVLEAANIEFNNIDVLDTLNDDPSKKNRNYAFLGLKLKKADASLGCWLQEGHSIKVRFGNVGADFLIIAGGEAQTATADMFANTSVEENKELVFTAPMDIYLEIVCNSTKTLVIKQIMLDEDIAAIELPEAPTAVENTNAEVKAIKRIVNGQLYIEKGGVLYNALGTAVR